MDELELLRQRYIGKLVRIHVNDLSSSGRDNALIGMCTKIEQTGANYIGFVADARISDGSRSGPTTIDSFLFQTSGMGSYHIEEYGEPCPYSIP